MDPVLAARDVFQDQGFWWKRIEPRPVSPSWLDSILAAVLDFFDRVYTRILELLAKILRSLFGVFTGASSGGTLAVWLIVGGDARVGDLETRPADRALAQAAMRQHQTGRRESTWQSLAEAVRPVRASRPGVPRWNVRRGDPAGTPGADCPIGETRSASLRHDSDQPRVPDGSFAMAQTWQRALASWRGFTNGSGMAACRQAAPKPNRRSACADP